MKNRVTILFLEADAGDFLGRLIRFGQMLLSDSSKIGHICMVIDDEDFYELTTLGIGWGDWEDEYLRKWVSDLHVTSVSLEPMEKTQLEMVKARMQNLIDDSYSLDANDFIDFMLGMRQGVELCTSLPKKVLGIDNDAITGIELFRYLTENIYIKTRTGNWRTHVHGTEILEDTSTL